MRKGLILGGFAFVLLSAGTALAQSVCYQVGAADDKTVIRWDVEPQSRLSSPAEQRRFGNPVMTTYRTHGVFITKFVPDAGVVPLHGTITVADGVGATNASHAPGLFAAGQFMSLECVSEQASPVPFNWSCRLFSVDIATKDLLEPSDFELTRLNPLQEPLCSTFDLP